MKYRKEGCLIIYTDESFVDVSHFTSKSWTYDSKKGKNKIKRQHVKLSMRAAFKTDTK